MLNNTKFHCPSAAPLLGPTVALALIEISQDLLTTMVVSHCSHLLSSIRFGTQHLHTRHITYYITCYIACSIAPAWMVWRFLSPDRIACSTAWDIWYQAHMKCYHPYLPSRASNLCHHSLPLLHLPPSSSASSSLPLSSRGPAGSTPAAAAAAAGKQGSQAPGPNWVASPLAAGCGGTAAVLAAVTCDLIL